jgi:hypothetical protein
MDEVAQTKELRLIIGRLEEFSIRVKDGLTEVDWSTQREIIRTLVKRVEIEQEKVNVVFRIAPNPSIPDLGKDCLQHCKGRVQDGMAKKRDVTLKRTLGRNDFAQ